MFYQKTVLDNGISIYTEHMDGVRSAALGFWVRTGARDERPEEYGMSHFMEHMLFKGTPTRTALEISTAFDALGADFNAFTGREYTCFYTRLIDERLPTGFEILADMLVNASFEHDCIVPERKVVIEEIARSQDTPDDYVYDVYFDAMFPTGPLGHPILGTKENVSSFDTDDMHAYHDAHYTSGNLTIVACGNVEHQTIVDLTRKYLSGINEGTRTERPTWPEETRVKLSAVKRDTEQAHLVFGLPTIAHNDSRHYVFSLLDAIMGGGMSSRLFQEIREKRGLVYSVYASSQLYEGSGVFGMYAGTRPDNISTVVDVARSEFAKAVDEGLTQEELDRAKELAAGAFVLGRESTRTHMTRLGRLAVLGLPIDSVDEALAKYRKVTLDEINQAADDLFTQQETIAVISPYDQEEVERMLT